MLTRINTFSHLQPLQSFPSTEIYPRRQAGINTIRHTHKSTTRTISDERDAHGGPGIMQMSCSGGYGRQSDSLSAARSPINHIVQHGDLRLSRPKNKTRVYSEACSTHIGIKLAKRLNIIPAILSLASFALSRLN